MSKKPSYTEIPKGIWQSFLVGTILSLVTLVPAVSVTKFSANIGEDKTIEKCKTEGYVKLVDAGVVSPDKITPDEVRNNCETIKDRVNTLLTKYSNGTNDFPVYITDYEVSFCGDNSLGCVSSIYKLNDNINPVMSISYSADYYYTLEHTVAHEYVHVLTSAAERKILNEDPALWDYEEPAEGVADCGISYFTGEFNGGSYMGECTPEQTRIAVAVIEDTLVK